MSELGKTENSEESLRTVPETIIEEYPLGSLRKIHEKMLEAYRSEKDKEQGARKALEIYEEYRQLLGYSHKWVDQVEDLRQLLEKSLEEVQDAREKGDRRGRRIRGSGSLVSKLVPCGKNCSGCPHGPYLYRVQKAQGKLIWTYLGKAM
jgi:hypothetical protein